MCDDSHQQDQTPDSVNVLQGFKGTPGPWRLQFIGAHEADLIHKGTFAGINGGSGCPDTLDADDYAIWEANARLCAAAPDLLAALQRMVEIHGGLGISPQVKAAIAAISRAIGADQ